MSSAKDYEEFIFENNKEVKIDLVNPAIDKDRKKKGKGLNHVSFFVDNTDYLTDSDKNKVVCVACTDTFFNIFFNDQRDENDKVMNEIFKCKVFMKYVPEEEIFRCDNCGRIELPRDPQISKQKEKKIMGAGIENFPEYVSYLSPDSVKADYIGTANINKRKSKVKPIFHEETEEEKFVRYYGGHNR